MKVFRHFASAAIVAAFSASLASQQGGQIGPSGGEVAAAAVGIGAVVSVVVVLAIKHSHHVMSGCVVSGPHGLELQTGDSKTYALEGDAANLKVGNRVKIHGSKVQKAKGVPGPDVFKVKKLDKDYGVCPVEHASVPGAAL
jgi:Protein of unknown function (DUF5818)